MADFKAPALIVFIKNPVLSRVKTRLAKTLGERTALEIYRQLLSVCRGIADQYKGPKYLYYSDEMDNNDGWNNGHYHKRVQCGNTLGERMFNAFADVFKQHSKAMIIGSDCPYLELQHLKEACEKIETCECVLGPTQDGGYYLLGMNDLYPELFDSIPWSQPSVLSTTLSRISDSGLSYALLEKLEDIDTEEDWERYKLFIDGE